MGVLGVRERVRERGQDGMEGEMVEGCADTYEAMHDVHIRTAVPVYSKTTAQQHGQSSNRLRSLRPTSSLTPSVLFQMAPPRSLDAK
jgi:hypothetical protein